MLTRTHRIISIIALIAFVIGAISAVIAGDWRMFALALLGAVIALVAPWRRGRAP